MLLKERIEGQNLKSLCFQRRVEALEGDSVWEKEAHVHQDPGGLEAWDALSDDSDFEPTTSRRVPYPHMSTSTVHSISRALHLAVVGGHDDVVAVLLDNGADINAYAMNMCDCPCYEDRSNLDALAPADHWIITGVSSLHLAVCFFRQETAKLLLRRGAPVRTSDKVLTPCFSALHTAAATVQASLCAFLLDEGYVDTQYHDGHLYGRGIPALFWAFYNGHWKTTAPVLLERGADLNWANPYELDDIDVDGEADDWEPSGPDGEAPAPDLITISKTFLYEACENGQFREALKSVRLGADVNKGQTSTLGASVTELESPLHVLCGTGGSQRRPPFSPPIQISQARDKAKMRMHAAS